MERLFIVTPIRDEIGNVERLFEALGRSAYPIERWVVCENGSTDGTRERLYELTPPGSVRELDILHLDTETRDYALGHKYARIVNTGFERVRDTVGLAPADMIGICDADNFPRLDYYVKLARAFDADAYLGITSGIDRLLDGDESIERWDWVRGSCRLWRGACFLQSGYTIGPSADTLSLARAELDGWRSYPVQDAVFDAREVGGRVDKSYYGRSAHFRGNTPLYAVLRGAKYLAAGQPRAAAQFLGGYFRAWRTNESRIDDPELYAFFQDYVRRVLLPSAWHSLSRRRTGLSK